MPNWCYTSCKLTGPEADIERFKQACLYVDPKPDGDNGINFQRIIPEPDHVLRSIEASEARDEAFMRVSKGEDIAVPQEDNTWHDWRCENWGTKWRPRESHYYVEDGRHKLCLTTAWSPPIPVLERIVSMFPTLAFVDFYTRDDMGNYFYKGTISAAGTDLVKDEEAEREWEEQMMPSASAEAKSRCEQASPASDLAKALLGWSLIQKATGTVIDFLAETKKHFPTATEDQIAEAMVEARRLYGICDGQIEVPRSPTSTEADGELVPF
jgi:hypothetical protein